jgi:hypothetical protein
LSNTNGSDTLTRPSYITVTQPGCTQVITVEISGPSNGLAGMVYSFVATVSPIDASEPIEYVWSPAPDAGQGTSVISYTWAVAGSQSIHVDVSNCTGAGNASDDHQIDISTTGYTIYLPVLNRD